MASKTTQKCKGHTLKNENGLLVKTVESKLGFLLLKKTKLVE